MNQDDKVDILFRDFYFGSGKDNPAVTVRLSNIEADARETRGTVGRHAEMLEGDTGLDRVVRNFISNQTGRDTARANSEVIWRWALTIGVALLVGLLEWHPWR